MKRLLANLILVILVLGGLFHVSHMHHNQEADFSTKQSYMSQYPKIPGIEVYPMTNIPF